LYRDPAARATLVAVFELFSSLRGREGSLTSAILTGEDSSQFFQFRASTAKAAKIERTKISLKAMVTLFPKKHSEKLRCTIRYLNITAPCMSIRQGTQEIQT